VARSKWMLSTIAQSNPSATSAGIIRVLKAVSAGK
jgi:hypothetical protein